MNINLNTLKKGSYGITANKGGYLAEAASVCLDDRGHSSPKSLETHDQKKIYHVNIHWSTVTDQMRLSHNDEQVATENGAYAIAALIMQQTRKWPDLVRSKYGSKKFDYWLGEADFSADADMGIFQEKALMEVSGIREGTNAIILQRVKKKLKQVQNVGGNLPIFVVVVEFSGPKVNIVIK